MAFQCVMVTPESQLLDESIAQAILPAHDGLLGILTDRAPLLVKLGVGPLRVDLAGGTAKYYLIDGGVAQMKDNKLTILTPSAQAADEIRAEAARAEYAEATGRAAHTPEELLKKQHDVEKARAKQALAKG